MRRYYRDVRFALPAIGNAKNAWERYADNYFAFRDSGAKVAVNILDYAERHPEDIAINQIADIIEREIFSLDEKLKNAVRKVHPLMQRWYEQNK